MRAVDTNVVIRFLTGDDPAQTDTVRTIMGHEPIFVTRTVLLEAEWVLRRVYEMPAARIIPALRALAGLPGVVVEEPVLVATAMDWAEAGMDFADALHVSAAAGCEAFLTFDKQLVRSGRHIASPPITEP